MVEGLPEINPREIVSQDVTSADIGVAVAAILLSVLLGWIARRGIRQLASREGADERIARSIARGVSIVILLLGIFTAMGVLEVRLGPLIGVLGIGSILLAIALREVLENIAAGIILLLRRPIRLGDQVEVVSHEGVVDDISLRATVIHTLDGERVYVPNRQVLGEPIINHTVRGRRRTTLTVGVRYDTDLKAAVALLRSTAGQVDGVHAVPPPEAWVGEFNDSSIDIAVRFWHAPMQLDRWRVRSAVAIACKAALDEAGMEIPFPQRTLHLESAQAPVRIARGDG